MSGRRAEMERRAMIVAAYVVVAAVVGLHVFDWHARPIWDGEAYDALSLEFVHRGYHFATEGLNNQLQATYAGRVLFIGLIGVLRGLLHLPLTPLCFWLDALSNVGTSCVLYVLARRHFGVPRTAAFLCGLSFQLFPNVFLGYQLQLHPDPLAWLFSAAAFLFFLSGQLVPCALSLFIGALTKQAVGLLVVYFVLVLLRRARAGQLLPRVAAVRVATLAGAVAAAAVISRLCAPPFHIDHAVIVDIWQRNLHQLIPRLLYNFDVFSGIFLVALLRAEPGDVLCWLGYLIVASVATAIAATDTWRVFFGMTFFWVLPTSWAFLWETCGTRRREAFLAVSVLVCLMLTEYPASFDMGRVTSMPMWRHLIVLLAVLVASLPAPARDPG